MDFPEGEILLFDKPLYWTSFDVVKKVKNLIRQHTGISKIKVGHAGTLDPLASGLLLVCTGKATKRIEKLQEMNKEYVGKFFLGATTPSFDLETSVDRQFSTEHISRKKTEEAIKQFLGPQMQVPPLFSAKNIEGKRAYEYARKGIERKLEPRPVVFHAIALERFELPEVEIRITCSKGTYIRSFARDLGEALDSGAYLSGLVRTSIGHYNLKDALSLENFEKMLSETKQNTKPSV